MFYNRAKKEAIDRLEKAEMTYNRLGGDVNKLAKGLYSIRKSSIKAINRVEDYVNALANTPKNFVKDIADVKVSITSFNEAVRIESENTSANIKGGGVAAGGTVVAGMIGGLGPTTAMAIATTFGTASTGTAISALSGAAASNAAIAWIGGGAISAGGGGMAVGNVILSLAGPVGWAIAGVAIVGGGAFAMHKNKQASEQAQDLAKETEERIFLLKPMRQKLSHLCIETDKLKSALGLSMMVNVFPADYNNFSIEQKETLAALINNTTALGKLINKRIS